MTELERRLEALASELAYPQADLRLRPRVRSLIVEQRQRRRRRRRGLLLALAFSAALLATVLAVPQARSALGRLLDIGAERVQVVKRVRPASQRLVPPGELVSLAAAQRRAGFRILLLRRASPPAAAYLAETESGALVTVVYQPRRPIWLSEFRAHGLAPVASKQTEQYSSVQLLSLNGRPAIWLGKAHLFSYLDSSGGRLVAHLRLAAKTLVWQRPPLTLRLEGRLSQAQALRLARRVH